MDEVGLLDQDEIAAELGLGDGDGLGGFGVGVQRGHRVARGDRHRRRRTPGFAEELADLDVPEDKKS